MTYRFHKPALVPTLAMFVVVALMTTLGVWQLERLQWKNALLARIESAQSAAPKNLLSYASAELPQAEWHNVFVTGKLLNDKELYATPRYLNEQMGYAVLTPLMVSTRRGPEYVLVNRGWVSPEKKNAGTRAGGNPKGVITVSGVLRNPLPQGMFRPDNNPGKNLWFWYDIPAMAKETDLLLLPVMIDATGIKSAKGVALDDGPIPFPIEIKIRNDHLGYAITWFLIGIIAVVMYVLYYMEKKE